MPAATAAEFYGASYAKSTSPSKLDDAFRWLNKAIDFEAEDSETKLTMAFKQALKCEAEAFA